jgi:hypothetical protein
MSAANPNPIEKSMVSVLIVENTGGGVAIAMWYPMATVPYCMAQYWRLCMVSPVVWVWWLLSAPGVCH